MSAERDHRTTTARGPSHSSGPTGSVGVGKQTLTGQLSPSSSTEGRNGSDELAVASRGAAGPGQRLPFAGTIQKLFGRHDVGGIQAHVGEEAAESSDTLGAKAYAMDNHVVFGAEPDLHTAAHEAAHVVQGRAGVHRKSGVSSSAPHEQHADAVADRVVAGQSAEDLLDRGVSSSPSPAVQRKEFPDDQQVFAQQAQLATTDVEIPALEGALLSTRKHAVQQGLLSQAAFDESLELARAIAKLQPAISAKAPVDPLVQQQAAAHAQLLYGALSRETSDDKNFDLLPSGQASTSFATRNRYTEEQQQTTMMHTRSIGSRLEQLPGLIRAAQWEEALPLYHRLREGLDRWVADRLRSKDKGSNNEALGNAQAHYTQMLTGLEQIADKHASRLPAVFHPDAETVAKEKAAGRPTTDTVPVNLYFWKDEATGKYHLRDLTTPSRPHELTIDGPPTAARLATFFEDVARYPRGEVRFALPSGEAGTAATTGKTKWYEWVAYAGLAIAAAGLALVTAGASVPATVCFAAGAIAGGVSAAGHLVDSARLGTATTTGVVVDASQIVASFASFGALSITIKAGGVAAALSQSRWFVPLTTTAAGADVVQLVALTDSAYAELARLENGPGTSDDKQRAMSILVTQLIVAGGLTVLSVRGARGARALVGNPLELVEQNGAATVRTTTGETHRSAKDPGEVSSAASVEPQTTSPPKAKHSTEPIISQPTAVGQAPDDVEAFLSTLSKPMADRFRTAGHATALQRAPHVLAFLDRVGEKNVAAFERFIVQTKIEPTAAIPLLESLLRQHPHLDGENVRAFATAFTQRFNHPQTNKPVSARPLQGSAEIAAAIDLSSRERYVTHPEQAVFDLRALIADNVELGVAQSELGLATEFGEPSTAQVAGPQGRGPDLRAGFSQRTETIGREMYATNLDTPATATPEEARSQLEVGLSRGIRDKARDYLREDIPVFTSRELAVQVRPSSGGFNFDSLLDDATFQRVVDRMRNSPDASRYGVRDTLNRIRFYDSTGRMRYEWKGAAGNAQPTGGP